MQHVAFYLLVSKTCSPAQHSRTQPTRTHTPSRVFICQPTVIIVVWGCRAEYEPFPSRTITYTGCENSQLFSKVSVKTLPKSARVLPCEFSLLLLVEFAATGRENKFMLYTPNFCAFGLSWSHGACTTPFHHKGRKGTLTRRNYKFYPRVRSKEPAIFPP